MTENTSHPRKILVIDPEDAGRAELARLVRQLGYQAADPVHESRRLHDRSMRQRHSAHAVGHRTDQQGKAVAVDSNIGVHARPSP